MASNAEIDRTDPTEPPEWRERREARIKAWKDRSDWKRKDMRALRALNRERLASGTEAKAVLDSLYAIAHGEDTRAAVVAIGLIVKLDEPAPDELEAGGEQGGRVLQLKRHVVDGEAVTAYESAVDAE